MRHIDALLMEGTGDEERPVAVERLLLRAHERNPVPRSAIHDAGQSAAERFRRRDAVVADAPVLVACGVFGPTTQLVTQVQVADPLRTEGLRKRFTVEPGIESAVRRGADIGHRGHVVLPQQREKRLQRVRGNDRW